MTKCKDETPRAQLQARVAKFTWGLFLIGVGVLFTLQNLGRLEVAPSAHPSASAVDGDPQTRWSSAFREGQWLAVDLGAPSEIRRIKLSWEAAHARDYELSVSDDGEHWETVQKVADAKGGIDDLSVSAHGRWVRVHSLKRATKYGVSLWEMEVYGPEGLLSQHARTTASSVEAADYWAFVWPVCLVAAGLPMLLVPKDAGNQVVGIMMVGVGGFFSLHNWGLTHLAFGMVWPVLLIIAGAVILLQSARGTRPGEPSSEGETNSTGSAQ